MSEVETVHIIKHTHEGGKAIRPQIAWCGWDFWGNQFVFQDLQHAALSIEHDDNASWYVCLRCVDAAMATLVRANYQRGTDAPQREET